MTKRVDLRVLIDGHYVPLPPKVATMVLSLVDYRETIRTQETGTVLLDHHQGNVTLSVMRRSFRMVGRRLDGSSSESQ